MPTRVSTNMIHNTLRGSIHQNLQNMLRLQQQMATQRKFHNLADNPAAIARGLSLESAIGANAQFMRNQADAITMLRHSEAAMATALDIAHEIRTLVIQAGNGALDRTEVNAIATRIDALQLQLMDVLNTRIAGRYIFGGTDTTTRPFVMDANGRIRYVGSDERIRYKIEDGILSDVAFSGRDLMPSDFRSFFICSHFVPLDWEWFGREEKVLIMVGNRTLSVFIPEQWIDEVATGRSNSTDNNQFRDPEEVRSISLDDLAMLVNRSLREQGADMLVTALVEKDFAANQQRLIFRSNTGERISVTGWPTTDPQPMPQSIAGLPMNNADLREPGQWNQTMLIGSAPPNFDTMAAAMVSTLTLIHGTQAPVTIDLDDYFIWLGATPPSVENFADWLNNFSLLSGDPNLTVIAHNDRIVFISEDGQKLQLDGSTEILNAVTGGISISEVPTYHGLMGNVNTLGWRGDNQQPPNRSITITIDGVSEDFNFNDFRNITELVTEINKRMPTGGGSQPVASIVSGRLVLQSAQGQISVEDTAGTPAGGTAQLFGQDFVGGITSSTSSLTIKVGENLPIKIFINEGDDLIRIADRINAIEGVHARTSANGSQLVVTAQRIGPLPSNPLAPDAAQERLHFPPITIWGEGMGKQLFNFTYGVDSGTNIQHGVITSVENMRAADHSHIDVFTFLNMETTLKGREFKHGETLTVGTRVPGSNPPVYEGEPLHWRVISGNRVVEIRLNPGSYTTEQLAERLRNAGAGWLEVTVSHFTRPGVPSLDDDESGLGTSQNREYATSRLVIRNIDGSPVSIMDMNGRRYAEEVGLSTALRTDDSIGLTNIRFPNAMCLDPNLPAMVRVQMTCGKTYDVRLTRRDIMGADGFVDRVRVMEQIARQVNAQAGFEMMRVVIPVDSNGRPLERSASLVAVTGEPFSVVDLPILDPAANRNITHTAGIAAQMGIHGGVTSNLALAVPPVRDNTPMGTGGTIRFQSHGRSVEIDVMPTDTVQNIMDRLRSQAGDWLYVNYFEENMNPMDRSFPIISIAARDGSPVNVIDVSGEVARERLLLSTGIQGAGGAGDPLVTFDPLTGNIIDARWPNPPITFEQIAEGDVPPHIFRITVAGFTHTIDMTAMRDINGNGQMDVVDLVATINARMQAHDVRAEINRDGQLVIWSPRGYAIEVEAWILDLDEPATGPAENITHLFFGGTQYLGDDASLDPNAPRGYPRTRVTYHRGGFGLGGQTDAGGNLLRDNAPGIFNQNEVRRSGANQMQQNFFGVLGDISAAVRAENRTGLSSSLLPKIDRFMDNLLRIMSTSGALEARYEGNIRRMRTTNLIKLEAHDELMGVDLSQITTELMMARALYEASLGVIALIVQPTLLNFLR